MTTRDIASGCIYASCEPSHGWLALSWAFPEANFNHIVTTANPDVALNFNLEGHLVFPSLTEGLGDVVEKLAPELQHQGLFVRIIKAKFCMNI